MAQIRPAAAEDAWRIAEIYVTDYRLNFYPHFLNDAYYFDELNVRDSAAEFADAEALRQTFVYDDGVIKGFIRLDGALLDKLFVEPMFQSKGIGAKLLQFAVEHGADHLWALKYNKRGIAFYQRNGFALTGEEIIEDEWVPLVKMVLGR
ncbi:MAG: GNAT family N-acetyltransferase [Oscillospiraceae bacterium]|nr:GNAT family N-acetyltransferase [Oscillospiraceae bacterium]